MAINVRFGEKMMLSLFAVSALMSLVLLFSLWTNGGHSYICASSSLVKYKALTPAKYKACLGMQGDGLSSLYTVDAGRTWQGIVTAVVMLAHSLSGCLVMVAMKKTKSRENAYVVGIMFGSCALMFVLALQTFIMWTQQTTLMHELTHHNLFSEHCNQGTEKGAAGASCMYSQPANCVGTYPCPAIATPGAGNLRLFFVNPNLSFVTITSCCIVLFVTETLQLVGVVLDRAELRTGAALPEWFASKPASDLSGGLNPSATAYAEEGSEAAASASSDL